MKRLSIILVTCIAIWGCDGPVIGHKQPVGGDAPGKGKGAADVRLAPLPVQQARAYPETVTGNFLSLVDFEDVPDGPRGYEQLRHFRISAKGHDGGTLGFVVNITRTGAGAMEVRLPAGGELVLHIPAVHDLSGYTLLSLAVFSRSLRDDLQVTLESPEGNWTSHRTLVLPGWNTVLFDIRRIERLANFDVRKVSTIRLAFADSAGDVSFNVDDIMLINNRRMLKNLPNGMSLEKIGLDYRLAISGQDNVLELTQCGDGLWRWGAGQTIVQLSSMQEEPVRSDSEKLGLMGARRVGKVEVIERNRLRLRIVNTWYFPARAGEWASLAVRRMRWEHTFYADGRHIVHLELNNAGGRKISSVRLVANRRAAWFGGGVSKSFLQKILHGPIARWSFMSAPPGMNSAIMLGNYLFPAKVTATLATHGAFAPGDADGDGFDESQGCYYLKARAGHCRFRITPSKEGLLGAVFRVAGNWSGAVSVNCAALAIRNVVTLKDGSVLFRLKGLLKGPISVEVQGKAD